MQFVDKVNAVYFIKCHNDKTKGNLLKLIGCLLEVQ